MILFKNLRIRGSLRFTRSFSATRFSRQSITNTKNEGQPRLDDLNVRTMKSPRSSQNPSRNLRRAFVPHFNLTRYNFRDDLEKVLVKYLKVKSCTTVTTAERYDLSKCITLLHNQGFQPVSLIPDQIPNIL